MKNSFLDYSSMDHSDIIEETPNSGIAIVGVSLRLPGANNLEEFWNILSGGEDLITEFPTVRKRDTDRFASLLAGNESNRIYARGAYLSSVDLFDRNFFKIAPSEADLMDPNQRIFLETAWNAIENAGYSGKKIENTRTGVYLGYTGDFSDEYMQYIKEVDPNSVGLGFVGNNNSIIASRISYLLNLKGPSLLVDTACSSSLVAVHLACQGIENGDCEMAIAGSIRINLFPIKTDKKDGIGIASSDGRAKAFDDRSDGTGSGEGSIAIILKSLSRAVMDKDHIYAVIKGTAINQDGRSNGITAPNAVAQEEVIVDAWNRAGINPETISYMEAHGTGTKLGDPIEIDGIRRAFSRFTNKKQFCGIGSLKSNIGHLDCASGLAGLVKCIVSLRHKKLPPSIHFQRPNRNISFEDSPVYFVDKLRDWTWDEGPLRCGVSSFGLSGTNCHLVLEEAPERQTIKNEIIPEFQMFTLSAKEPSVLLDLINLYVKFIQSPSPNTLEDICYTLSRGREHHPYRLIIIARDMLDLLEKLTSLAENSMVVPANVTKGEIQVNIKGLNKTEQAIRELTKSSDHYIERINEENELLSIQMLGELYVQGADINWDKLASNGQIIALPAYPFARMRCWLQSSYNKIDFFKLGWRKSDNNQYDIHRNDGKTILMMVSQLSPKVQEWSRLLAAKGKNIIMVESGYSFEKMDNNHYIIDSNQNSYNQLFNDLKSTEISQIVSVSSRLDINGSYEQSHQEMQQGVYQIFYIVRALVLNHYRNTVDLTIVSRDTFQVLGEENKIYPEHALSLGLGKALNYEYERISCRMIDIDEFTSDANIVNEIESLTSSTVVAFRNDEKFLQELDYLPTDTEDPSFELRQDGVYVITGGLGGIGLEIAKSFAQMKKINIVLLGRSSLPECDHWNSILTRNECTKESKQIQNLLELKSRGSEVVYYSVDVSNEIHLSSVLEEIRNRFGVINGLIHAAGEAGNGIIATKEESDFSQVLSAKVTGSLLLDKLTASDEMDFFVMCSALSAVYGQSGQGDYCAANAFQDAYAVNRTVRGKKTISINWPAWKETGMAFENDQINENGLFHSLTNDEGIAVLKRAIMLGVPNVIVGSINNAEILTSVDQLPFLISDRVKERIIHPNIGERKGAEQTIVPRSKVVSLTGKKQGEYSKSEKLVGQICGDLLGYEQINLFDNLFKLGMDSIISIRFLDKLMDQFKINVELDELYEHPTIHELSSYIEDKNGVKRQIEDSSDTDNKDISSNNQPLNIQLTYPPSFLNVVSGSTWRQLDCFDRGALLMFTETDTRKLCYAKVLLGLARGYDTSEFAEFNYKIFASNETEDKLYETLLGYQVEKTVIPHISQLHTSIKKNLLQNNRIMVYFDEYYCFYSPYYLTQHTKHQIVITGYDDHKRGYSIIDYNQFSGQTSQQIQYGPFWAQYDLIETIYSNMKQEDRIVIVLNKLQENPIVTSNGIMDIIGNGSQKFKIKMIQTLKELMIGVEQDRYFNTDTQDIYVQLGGMELFLLTVIQEYGLDTTKKLAQDLLTKSEKLATLFATSKFRNQKLAIPSTLELMEEIETRHAELINSISLLAIDQRD